MTPYELSISIKVFNEKQKLESEIRKHEIENQLTVAYFNARWQRVGKLSIKDLTEVLKKLNGEDKPKRMTPEEMLNEVKKLNAAFGGTVY
ncbi:hypothetical protein AM500_21370 [Bacillus sp. FJAT-18017]|uniref:hypothetical protein n=1 Tax=Bacillus sp. FJAT-18017 TaxID=1705566 RepID=UPI0006B04F64|nr:hypothetical protein [Bacillus sp. FJAT-18017]ALC92059.1 hypothetical protein AM500_21370 [Bacillus sp. FJAT-18017]